jgi:hypothetical protein
MVRKNGCMDARQKEINEMIHSIVVFSLLCASCCAADDLFPVTGRYAVKPLDLMRVGCKLSPDLGSGVNTKFGVVTCWHCVNSGKPIIVECDGEIGRGTVIAKDESADVALIAVPWKLPHPTVGVSSGIPYGEMQLVSRSPSGPIAIQSAEIVGQAFGGMVLISPPTVAGQSGGSYIDSSGNLAGIVSGNVVDSEPFRGLMIPASAIRRILPANAVRQSAGIAESAPTPYAEIERVLNLLPKPRRCFVDFGCGADARWCLAAAEKWQCKCIGMEIDPTRAKLAQERVKAEGFADLIEIYCADSTQYTYENCDVGIAYLYPATLQKLKPQIERLTAFASMFHQPPVPAVQNGNVWIYQKSAMSVARQAVGYWNGVAYSSAAAGCNCPMCQSLNWQIAQARAANSQSVQPQAKSASGHTVKQKVCTRQGCYFIDVWVPD